MNDNTINPSILNLAAQKLFCDAIQKLEQDKSSKAHHLSEEQLERLASKILLLPEDWQEALLLHYGCGFDSELTGDMLGMDNAKGNILYAKDTLAYSMGVADIADESITYACHIVLKQLHTQIQESQLAEPQITTSRNFDKKIRRLFRRQANAVYVDFRTAAKRVAIILLAVLITSAITVFSVEALRNRFFDWWFSIFPTHTRVEFVDVIPDSNTDNIYRLRQYAPTTLPEGFKLIDTYENDQRYKLFYEKVTGERIIFEVRTIESQDHTNVNTQNNEMEEIVINNQPGYYVNDELGHMILWSYESCFFNVICETTKNDAIKIAESTKKK